MSFLKSIFLGVILTVSSMNLAQASFGSSSISAADAKAYAKIEDYILEAERKSGESADLVAAITYIESNCGKNTKNPYSNVKGVMQYTDRQWRSDLRKHAKRMGVSAKSSVHNKRANILIGAAGLAENRKYLEGKVKHAISDGDVYMSWFVGLYGAEKILKGNPNAKISKYVKLSKGNWNLYTVNGKIATVAQFRAKMNSKIKNNKQQFAGLINQTKLNELMAKLQDGDQSNYATAVVY